MEIRVNYWICSWKNKMKHILLLACSLIPSLLFADNVTVEQAQSLATHFFQASAQTRSISPQVQLVWNGEELNTRTSAEPAFYVFNRTDEKGFIILSGDDIAMPVLGYSFKNSFTADNMPMNLKEWLQEIRKQINFARSRKLTASAETEQSWKNIYASIGKTELQLETAQWNQDEPYNKDCPTVNGKRAVTGCVATALAIVMRYYQWPDKGVGILPSYNYPLGSWTRTQPGHALGYAYNWDRMPLKYERGNYSPEEAQAVATLMFDCGVMSKATYSDDETGAYTQDAVQALVTYMKYSKNARILERDWYATDKWVSMLKQEIRTNGPVLYGGSSESGGHQFVFDGYTSTDYFGVNWGWGGYMNGYYRVSALDPSGTGIGGGTGGYRYNQSAVFGLKKAEGDSELMDFLMLGKGRDRVTGKEYNGLSTDEVNFETGKSFYITVAYFWNVGFNTFKGELILSLVDEEGNWKEDICKSAVITEVLPGEGMGQILSCKIAQPLSEGDRVWLRYRGINSLEWKRMPTQEGTVSEIIVKPADGKSISESTSFSYNKATKIILLKTKKNVSYTVTSITGGQVLSGTADASNEIRIDAGTLAAGKYTLILQKGDSRKELTFVTGK